MKDQPDWNDLLELIARFDGGDYENVSVQFGDVSLRMSRTGSLGADDQPSAPPKGATGGSAAANNPTRKSEPSVASEPDLPVITSPMIGVFYRQSSPGTPPFVEPGQTVSADTIIGIVEIMKLMNPVKAGISGVIRNFLVKDGEAVEFGQALALLDVEPS